VCGEGHEPPLTVLAEEEFPVLADPVESDDDPVLDEEFDEADDADGVAVVVVPVDDVTEDVDTLLAVDAPACVSAAAIPSAATATPPATPSDTVSFRRRRSA
jgi:hypothetical protein